MNELEQKFLEHTAAGTQWSKHRYLYITPSGRYVYPEDVKNGGGAKYGSREYEQMTARSGKTINTRSAMPTKTTVTKTVKPSTASTKTATKTPTSTSVNKTNQAAAQIAKKSTSSNTTQNKTEDKKNEEKLTIPSLGTSNQTTSKKSTSKKSTKKKSSEKSTVSQEAQNLNLTEDDIKLLSSNIDTNATSREDVINGVALKVIRGDFGNGKDRQEKLGRFYGIIQARVNELMKTMRGQNQAKKNTSKKVKKTTTKNTSSKSVKYGSAEYEKQKKSTSVNTRKTFQHSDEEEFLMHLGTKKHSGRYAYGSGDRPYQHDAAARRRYNRVNKRQLKRLTDEELNNRIERYKKEAELLKYEKDAMTTGEKFVQDMLIDTGKKTVPVIASALILYAGKKWFAGEMDKEGLGEAILKSKGGGKKKD